MMCFYWLGKGIKLTPPSTRFRKILATIKIIQDGWIESPLLKHLNGTGEGMKQNKICWKTSVGIETLWLSGSSFSVEGGHKFHNPPTRRLKAWIRSKSHLSQMGPGFDKDFSTWILLFQLYHLEGRWRFNLPCMYWFIMAPYKWPPVGSGDRHLLSPQCILYYKFM